MYRINPGSGDKWERINSVREAGGWLRFSADTLETYITAIDNTAPVMEWSLRKITAEENGSIRFAVKVQDNSANPDVQLRIHVGGASSDMTVPLAFAEDGEISDAVPTHMVTERGLWYSLEARDGANLVSLDTIDVKVKLERELALPADIVYPEGQYHMISVPLQADDNHVKELFYDDWGEADPEKWRLFTYDSRFHELDGDDDILPGRAYWLRTKGFDPGITLDGAVTLPVSGPYAVPATEGWNCVANPFLFNVDTRGVATNSGSGSHPLYAYENSVWLTGPDIGVLRPWHGYLVWNGAKGTPLSDSIYISPVEQVPAAKQARTGREGRICISVENSVDRDGLAMLAFGRPGSEDGRDERDLIKPLLFRKPLELSVVAPWDESAPYLSDYRDQLGEGQSWRIRIRNETGKAALLRFSDLETLPQGIRAMLLDGTSGRALELSASGIELSGKRKVEEDFDILVGTPEYLETMVHEFKKRACIFSLEQNLPNPFYTETSIRYSIPASLSGPQPVMLRIYDMQGKLVRELVNGDRKSGFHEIIWSGRDENGRRVSAGTYVCRLSVRGEFEAKRKLVLLK
jgi:hypothetical protein